MSYYPGSVFYKQFTSFNISGISTNADFMPWATMVKNGIDDSSVKIFVKNINTGRYTISGIIPPSYKFNDYLNICISGYSGGNLSQTILELGLLDLPVNKLNTISVTGIVNSNVVSFLGVPAQPYNGIAKSATINTITLADTEPTLDDYYKWVTLLIVGGTGINQFGLILSYSGATRTAYMDKNWSIIPNNTSQYFFTTYNNANIISANPGVTISVTGLNIPESSGLNNIYQGVNYIYN